MQEIILEQKNWLQLYVDAMTEKDPYKRLALVRRLRQVPRHDESDENPERPRLHIVPKTTPLKPPVIAPAPLRKLGTANTKAASSVRIHHGVQNRSSKGKTAPKSSRSNRFRTA